MSATTTSDSLAMSATQSSRRSACAKIGSCLGGLFVASVVAMIGLLAWYDHKVSSEYKCPDFTINGAYLSLFNYTESNHTLSYNLALNITLTNPKKKIFRALVDVKLSAYYQDKRIGQVILIDRWMSTSNNTVVFRNVVVEEHDMLFEESVIPAADDIYSIDVVIGFQDKKKAERHDVMYKGEVIYNLRLPLSFNGTSWDADKTTHCPREETI